MTFNLYKLGKFMILPTEVIDIITDFSNPYKRIHKILYTEKVLPELLISIQGECVDCREDWAYIKGTLFLQQCYSCRNKFCNNCISSYDCSSCLFDYYYELNHDTMDEEWDELVVQFRRRSMYQRITNI
jgi:hypothetical protein